MRNEKCQTCGRGYNPVTRFIQQGIGGSLLLCIRELRQNKGKRPGNLQERLLAAYNDFYAVYNICRAGHNTASNLYGKAGIVDKALVGVLHPDQYTKGQIAGGYDPFDWDALERDIAEIGSMLDFELERNVAGANCNDPGYEVMTEADEEDYLKNWLKKVKE
jgi:hypothetical protein